MKVDDKILVFTKDETQVLSNVPDAVLGRALKVALHSLQWDGTNMVEFDSPTEMLAYEYIRLSQKGRVLEIKKIVDWLATEENVR